MADELEKPSFNFGIESTMEVGNQELLKDLFEEESVTTAPEKISKIEKKKIVTKPIVKKEEEEEEDDEPKLKPLEELLLENEEEEQEEEEPSKKPVKKAPVSKTEEVPVEEDEPEEGEPVNQFQALSKDLFKLGVFTQGEEEEGEVDIKDPETFLERFKIEKQKGATEMVHNFIGQFGEDYQQAFDAIFVKGVPPKEYLTTYNAIENFSQMDITKEDNQVAVVRQFLKDSDYEDVEIEAELERIKNFGDLEAMAQRHHKVLIKKETAKLQDLERQSQEKIQKDNAYKQQYIQNVSGVLQEKLKTKEFDGIPLNPKIANELQDFLLVDKYKTSSGEKLTDFDRFILDLKRPENHTLKVKVALLLKTLEKDPSLATIQKVGVTKESNRMFNELVGLNKKTSSKTVSSTQKSPSWNGL